MKMPCAVTECICLHLACDVVFLDGFEAAPELIVALKHTGPLIMVSQRRNVKNASFDLYVVSVTEVLHLTAPYQGADIQNV